MDVGRVVSLAGGGCRWSQLRDEGVSRREIAAAVRQGRLISTGTGGYSLPDAPPATVAAVRTSSTLACMSALEHRGMSLLLPPDRPHLESPRYRTDGGIVCHRGRCWDSIAVSPERALAQLGVCRPPVEVLVALDAAARTGLVEIPAVLSHSRSRNRIGLLWALHHLDARAESVIESALGAHLIRAGVEGIELQVELPDVGRVDLLIDGWLVVEADGFENHSRRADYRNDRRRGVSGVVQGWVTLRFSYEDIKQRSEQVVEAVIATLARHRGGRFRTATRRR